MKWQKGTGTSWQILLDRVLFTAINPDGVRKLVGDVFNARLWYGFPFMTNYHWGTVWKFSVL